MRNKVECWHYEDDYLIGRAANEVEIMDNFDLCDPYINDTFSAFEIIAVSIGLADIYTLMYVVNNCSKRHYHD